jgi:hypothetical protein
MYRASSTSDCVTILCVFGIGTCHSCVRTCSCILVLQQSPNLIDISLRQVLVCQPWFYCWCLAKLLHLACSVCLLLVIGRATGHCRKTFCLPSSTARWENGGLPLHSNCPAALLTASRTAETQCCAPATAARRGAVLASPAQPAAAAAAASCGSTSRGCKRNWPLQMH